jgi:hypothetical protein
MLMLIPFFAVVIRPVEVVPVPVFQVESEIGNLQANMRPYKILPCQRLTMLLMLLRSRSLANLVVAIFCVVVFVGHRSSLIICFFCSQSISQSRNLNKFNSFEKE